MAANIERLYRETIERTDPSDAHYKLFVRQHRELLEAVQLEYLEFEAFPKTESQVKEELARQVDIHVENGIHEHPKINLSKARFKNKILKLAEAQPEEYDSEMDIPVVLFGQIPDTQMCKIRGVDYYLQGLRVKDWRRDPGGWKTPKTGFLTWMHDGVKNLNMKVEDVRNNLVDESVRGATGKDTIGLHCVHPKIITHHGIDSPGTSVGPGSAPYLRLFRDGPRLRCRWVGLADPGCGSALCGRKIRTW